MTGDFCDSHGDTYKFLYVGFSEVLICEVKKTLVFSVVETTSISPLWKEEVMRD